MKLRNYKISNDPAIIFFSSQIFSNKVNFTQQFVETINKFSSNTVNIFVWSWWNVSPEMCVKIESRIKTYRSLVEKNLNFTILSNTFQEYVLLKSRNIHTIYCNHNSVIDPSIFYPTNNKKKYNAIYNARFLPFKRHELSYHLENVAYLANGNVEMLEQIKLQKSDGIFLNQINGSFLVSMTPSEVNDVYNSSYVGLCLSSCEGAMYSSVEYLLSGIPLLSTASVGGRDLFFDTDNSLICKDCPYAIKNGVSYIINNYNMFDSKEIRKKTILKQNKFVRNLKTAILKIFTSNNNVIDIDTYWNSIYRNKML